MGLGRDNFDVDGYWRKGVADHDHHDDDTEAPEDSAVPDVAVPTGSTADAGSSAPASGPSGD
ncbi:hypothetical protein D3C74_449270 [compost metagenome]